MWLAVVALAAGASVQAADQPASLKDAFMDHFAVGTAVSRSMVTGGAAFRRSAEQNAGDVALLKRQFKQISPENDLKWQSIHPREGADGYDFAPADTFVNFGLSNIMQVVGHALVWHSQTPNWVFASTNPPPSTATNTAPGPGGFGRGFGGYTGPRASRDELLQAQKVPVHAIGSQAHINVSTRFDTMDQSLTEIATLGLPIHITELDVNSAAISVAVLCGNLACAQPASGNVRPSDKPSPRWRTSRRFGGGRGSGCLPTN